MRDNAKRLLNRRFWQAEGAPKGSRSPIRAAPEAQVRLQCLGPVAHQFKAAEQMQCPHCQHRTRIIGHVQ